MSIAMLRRQAAMCLVAAATAVASASCGRGPVEPPPVGAVGVIQFQFVVNGTIDPTQGNYIIAINSNVTASTNVNSSLGETPGEPTAQEATSIPPTYTHWDQQLIYGSASGANAFLYKYKLLTGTIGATTATFFPIILTSNQFQLVPNGSVGTGTGNALSITIPIALLSIRGNSSSANPPTVMKPAASLIYVNYITTDTAGNPQDQLGANGLGTVGFTQTVDLTKAATIQLPNFSSATGPPNPSLFITGGQIVVTP